MAVEQLGKAYEASQHEDAIYREWEKSGFFNPDVARINADSNADKRGKRLRQSAFSIAMPPPNVTGQLHIGHAMMLAIEDVMIRFERMRGKKALWVPGFDHASIATQNVVEKKIWKEEKKTRHDLGREEFLRRVDAFVQDAKTVIRGQIKKMGASCDWSRERYTLDEGLSHAVQTLFVRMYEDGLIYRGDRIVNWCTRCASTLADDEVNYREERSKFYYCKYGPVVIGTARPETKFLDKVIVVHPDDTRYTKFVGKEFDVEWIDGKVRAKVVADATADPALGTGAMTITPAHSFEDFALAQKYGFDVRQIIGQDGLMTDAAGSFAGMPVDACRTKVVARLQEKGLIDRIDENYVHNLSVCYRCDTPIQPLVSKQWFVSVSQKSPHQSLRSGTGRAPVKSQKLGYPHATASLKDLAIWAVRSNQIKIVPDRFNATYFQWMENLHDWCISRQIWFGHRIPVWYCRSRLHADSNAEETQIGVHPRSHQRQSASINWVVALTPPAQCPYCGSCTMVQDPDTLDTWFSSGLWTFSTLGWPENTKSKNHKIKKSQNDLQIFHPTSVLETGYDILFFWVARMIMMTTYALDDIPFKTVYLHGLVRDKQGRKMSKSLGNGIDPLDVIAKYGADAVRLSLIIGGTPGNDVRLYDEKIAGFRNFVNKLWNIGRFVLSNYRGPSPVNLQRTDLRSLTLADRWILSRLQRVIASVTDDLVQFRFSQAGETLREFTWGDFADWYLEIKKIESDPNQLLITNYQLLLKLWHPFMPYVTEVLFHRITESQNHRIRKDILRVEKSGVEKHPLLMVAEWPTADNQLIDSKTEHGFGILREAIAAIRNARATYHVPAAVKLKAQIVTNEHRKLFTDCLGIIERLAYLASCTVMKEADRPADAITATIQGAVIYLSVGGIVDVAKEQERLKKEIEQKMTYVSSLEKKLTNEEFVQKAPVEIVASEKAKWEAAREELERLREFLV